MGSLGAWRVLGKRHTENYHCQACKFQLNGGLVLTFPFIFHLSTHILLHIISLTLENRQGCKGDVERKNESVSPSSSIGPARDEVDEPSDVLNHKTIAVAVVVVLVAHGFAMAKFDSTHGFSEMSSDLQREMIFTTESGDEPTPQ